MNTKRNRLATALLSIAALGLTSVGLQAQDATDDMTQMRERLQMGKMMERPELSPELQALVDSFRAKRAELIAAHHEERLLKKQEMLLLLEKYRAASDEDKPAIAEEIRTLKNEHREAVRAFRMDLRDEMRLIREQRRLEAGKVEG